MNAYQESLAQGIKATHGCKCKHVGSVSVHEMNGKETVWSGEVEVFALEGHKEATQAYAWGWEGQDGEVDCVAIINKPPVESPREAVQIAIASGRFS